jgi:hypothetical protein
LISLIKNKRGDIPSLIYLVIIIGLIGFVFIFVNKLNHGLLTQEESILNSSIEFQNSSAITAIQSIRGVDDVAWDYAFLALYIGSICALGISAYSTRISPIFYWFYFIMSLGVLIIAVMMSNLWQAAVATDALSDSVSRFPITNFLLGSYYPIAVLVMIIITMILLFGKTPDGKGPFG